jgi:drug/metabolite transporter (DMT)-like permease
VASDRLKNAWASAGFAAMTVVWGTQFLVIKRGQVDLPPLMTAALRFAVLTVAAQVAVLLLRPRADLQDRVRRASFGVTQALSFGLLYWGQSRVPSALAGVLLATTPLFVAVLAHWFVDSERQTVGRVSALTLGFMGIAVIVFGTESSGGAVETIAVLAILVGSLASAANKVLAKRMTANVPAPILLRDMGLIVTALVGLASVCFERGRPMNFTPESVLSFVYLGLVASFAASGLYLVLLRRYAVTAMAYLQFGTATVAAAVGIILGGERLEPSLGMGVLAILAGLLILSKAATGEKPFLQEKEV